MTDCQLLDYSKRSMTTGTFHELYEKTELKLIRLYLATKYKIHYVSSKDSLPADMVDFS